jgi:5-methylcytosine-specific restriction protein A
MMAMRYPIQAFSWEVLSARVAIKHMDKSVFLHHGTAIPKEICSFFDLRPNVVVKPISVKLVYQDSSFSAHFEKNIGNRFRLFWKAAFSERIQSRFPGLHEAFTKDAPLIEATPLIRFEKLTNYEYLVDLVLPGEIQIDIQAQFQEETEARPEGALREYFGKRYERDPRNRKTAINYHGFKCKVCGFSFSGFYGTRGDGFIEIHHTKPLANSGRQEVNPKTDLLPVCANCHRMIHRRSEDVLSIEELKKRIRPSS